MMLDTNAAVRHLIRSDAVMRRIVNAVGDCGLRPGRRGDHFTTLLRAIVGQQLSAKAAETIWQRVVALHEDGRRLRPEEFLAHPHRKLRSAGMSRAKVRYARDLARCVASGELDLRQIARREDEQIIASLTEVDGIGRWTVEMFLIFKIGRPDVWSLGDLGLRNAVARAYRIDPTPQNLLHVAQPWRPWRSVASWYLWRSLAL